MKTAMQELINWLEEKDMKYFTYDKAIELLEKEKEQIKKAFCDGQDRPINHPNLPHYSNEEYFNETYQNN